MIRTSFDNDLQQLQDDLLALSDMVEEALANSVEMLRTRDVQGSRNLINHDRVIDDLRYKIEADALTLIVTQQPMAGDMRLLAAVLFISNELERIGDYAKGVSRVNRRIGGEPLMKPLIDIPEMADCAREMLHGSMDAFVQRDVEIARSVIAKDDRVDALYDQVYAELMTLIMQDTSKIRQANLLLMAAHHLERAADRATNICERVIYCVTGQLVDTGWEDDLL